MAYVKFRNPGEPSIKKNYIPNSVKFNKWRLFWKILALISIGFNVLLIMKGAK